MPLLAKHAIMEQLLAEDIKHVFGNPGSTELFFTDALQDYPQIQYIMGLHETVPMAMAEGYGRATGRPSVVNVHIAPGLANAMSMIYNAKKTGSPIVVTVGQQDTRFLATEPLLAADLVEFAKPWVKMAAEVIRSEDTPMILRRAFKVAGEPPWGPVVVSLPQNLMDGEVYEPITPTTHTSWNARPDPAAAHRVARLLSEASSPLLLVGDHLALSNAHEEVARLAEQAGAPVMQTTSRMWNFPTNHPLYAGPLGFLGGMREGLAGHDVIVAIGCGDPFMSLWYEGGSPLPEGSAFVQIDIDTWELAKNYPATETVLADPYWGAKDVLEAMEALQTPAQVAEAQRRVTEIKERIDAARRKANDQLTDEWDNTPISPMRLAAEIRDAAPSDAVYVGSGGTSGRGPVQQLIAMTQPGSFFEGNASLGFPLPGTLGVKLAYPDRPVIGLLREGDSMYSIQGLWTAVKYNIDVTYVVFNNASYRILKQGMVRYLGASERQSQYLGLDFGEPAIDLARQAQVWDIPARRVTEPGDIAPALREAIYHPGPALVDVVIDGSYGRHF